MSRGLLREIRSFRASVPRYRFIRRTRIVWSPQRTWIVQTAVLTGTPSNVCFSRAPTTTEITQIIRYGQTETIKYFGRHRIYRGTHAIPDRHDSWRAARSNRLNLVRIAVRPETRFGHLPRSGSNLATLGPFGVVIKKGPRLITLERWRVGALHSRWYTRGDHPAPAIFHIAAL